MAARRKPSVGKLRTAAFGLDERTVARWLAGAGQHGQRVHEHLVEQGQVDLQQVQADELWVKQVGAKVWMALALAVPTRRWLGGVSSRQRDLPLITRLVQRVRACAVPPVILVCVDGLASYVPAFRKVFRQPISTGRRGRPRLVLPDGFPFAQVVKRSAKRHVIGVTRRVVCGTLDGIEAVLTATATGTVSTTADLERLNATFRAHLVPLTRRGRAIHPHCGGPHRRPVAGRHRLQRLLASRQPPPARARPRSSQVAPPNSRQGGWAHRSLLVAARPAPLPDPLTPLGPTQTTGPDTDISAAQSNGMTTLPWGATRVRDRARNPDAGSGADVGAYTLSNPRGAGDGSPAAGARSGPRRDGVLNTRTADGIMPVDEHIPPGCRTRTWTPSRPAASSPSSSAWRCSARVGRRRPREHARRPPSPSIRGRSCPGQPSPPWKPWHLRHPRRPLCPRRLRGLRPPSRPRRPSRREAVRPLPPRRTRSTASRAHRPRWRAR